MPNKGKSSAVMHSVPQPLINQPQSLPYIPLPHIAVGPEEAQEVDAYHGREKIVVRGGVAPVVTPELQIRPQEGEHEGEQEKHFPLG